MFLELSLFLGRRFVYPRNVIGLGWKASSSSKGFAQEVDLKIYYWAILYLQLPSCYLKISWKLELIIILSIWLCLRDNYNLLLVEFRWIIGRHSFVHFWLDNWLGKSIVNMFNIPQLTRRAFTATIVDYYQKWFMALSQWVWIAIPVSLSFNSINVVSIKPNHLV